MRFDEIDRCLQAPIKLFEIGELRAIVKIDATNRQTGQKALDELMGQLHVTFFKQPNMQKAHLAVCQSYQQAFAHSSINSVPSPIADPAACFDFLGPLQKVVCC